MLVSRRKLVGFLTGLLGISLLPKMIWADNSKDVVVGNSVSINPKSNFYCKSESHKQYVLKDSLRILGLGFKKYDEDNGTHAYEQAQAAINASRESWAEYLSIAATSCGKNEWVNIYVSVNLTKKTSESGIKLEVPPTE